MEGEHKILIADDEAGVRELLTDLLSGSFNVDSVDRGDAVLGRLAEGNHDILILDLQLPGMNGIDVLRAISEKKTRVMVVIITASNNVETAITTMKLGAYDYLVKPFDTDKLLVIIKNIVEKLELEKEVDTLREQVGEKFRFRNIIGKSASMLRVFSTLERVIDTDSTILISGDSGTGKEIIAKAIHYNSNRKQFPFRSLDCSTIPKDLIGSELFGHEKGAFTGAISRKIGKFELASKGTLFLDEIGNLSIDMQAKLLRVLQEKEFERIGGNQIIRVNTRIVAATNKDLRELVQQNRFREDLYYRLNVVPVYLPLLRDRKEDMPLFIDHFLRKYNQEYGRTLNIDIKARIFLTEYRWPGNVRQLENVIKRLVLLSTGQSVDTEQVKAILDLEGSSVPAVDAEAGAPDAVDAPRERKIVSLDEMERDYLERALEKFGYNISLTAKALEISRKTMHNKLKKYGIVIRKTTGV
ncbi:MAG: sigma-54-dependent Fis family transcriptional regulator [Spirochaetes bacterium]|nr:sigma-54-dependent Fis family transcriptional regulator [Spirochaetota bacterium]